MTRPQVRNVGFALHGSAANTAMLICCVLPTVFVLLGVAAVAVSLVAALPQLIWVSTHRALIFTLAAALLMFAGVMLWRSHTLSCPAGAERASGCLRLRRFNATLYAVSVMLFLIGAAFALWPVPG